jgi:hypothetical protein
MNCLQFENALSDYLEGVRSSEQQAHLNACSACSSLLADLNLIAGQVSLLREVEEPSPSVWNALEAQLRREGLIRESAGPLRHNFFLRWRTAWLVPVAAALVIAAAVKFYQPARVGDTVPIAKKAPAPAMVSAEDKDILSTVASGPPSRAAAYRIGLEQANAFIRDAEAAAKSNPNDIYSQQLLINAYEQKQMLYRLAVDQGIGEQ